MYCFNTGVLGPLRWGVETFADTRTSNAVCYTHCACTGAVFRGISNRGLLPRAAHGRSAAEFLNLFQIIYTAVQYGYQSHSRLQVSGSFWMRFTQVSLNTKNCGSKICVRRGRDAGSRCRHVPLSARAPPY